MIYLSGNEAALANLVSRRAPSYFFTRELINMAFTAIRLGDNSLLDRHNSSQNIFFCNPNPMFGTK